jgi:hypothetical protein
VPTPTIDRVLRWSQRALGMRLLVGDRLEGAEDGDRDLLAELEELVGPVLDAFRRVTARPRRIERLRRQIDEVE